MSDVPCAEIRFERRVTDYTRTVSDNRWEVPVDVTALDPDDPEVAEEVARRLKSGDLQVAESSDAYDPLRLQAETSNYVSLKKSLFGCLLLVLASGAIFCIMGKVTPWVPGAALLACGILLIFRKKILASAPPARFVRKEVTRQVRLSEMARRNSARYRAVAVPGDSLFPRKNNPVLGESLLSAFTSTYSYEVGDSFCSMAAGSEDDADMFPCEWGNLVLYASHIADQAGERPIVFRGWYMMVALPRGVPHIVLDAKADNFGSDLVIQLDPSQRVRMDPGFDSRFIVYAPQGYAQDARDLISDVVRQQLTAVATDENVELAGEAVIFFSPDSGRWDRPEPWERANRLRDLVQTTMYPRIGEYVDAHARTSGKKKGQYDLLPTSPRAPRIAAQGKVLRPYRGMATRRVVTIMLLTFAITVVPMGVIFRMAVTDNKVGAVITVVAMCVCWIVLIAVIIRSQLRRHPKRDRNLR